MQTEKESIPFKSIIMRCDKINKTAFEELPSRFSIERYKDKMENVWVGIMKESGQFKDKSEKQIYEYFANTFLQNKMQIYDSCFFLKDNSTGKFVGTCTAWFSNKSGEVIPILHWLVIVPSYRNMGCARILITQVMKYFDENNSNEPVYLHTQPESFKAIKLYNDFGFNIAKEDCYGHAVNEYEEAMKILEKVMTPQSFERLKQTAVD